MYDILIKNGRVFNGLGNASTRIDIGIKGDKIVKFGDLLKEKSEKIIDAENFYVTPGFIDITNHSDARWTLFSDQSQESLIRQGITTVVGGNCGSSLAPIISGKGIETIQKWTNISEINVNWQGLNEFFSVLDSEKLGINFATLIGHGTLRRAAMNDATKAAKNNEIKEMEFLLKEAMEEGAFGISFDLSSSHERESSADEIIRLSKIAAEYNGLTKHHLKNEGGEILSAIAEIINFAKISKAKTQISHFKILGRKSWGRFPDAIFIIESAIKNDKVKLTLDIFPYTKTGSNLYAFLPFWAKSGGKEGILNFLKDAANRKKVIGYLEELTLHYDKIIVASALEELSGVGKTIKDISQNSGISPEETIINLLEVNRLKASIFNETIFPEHIESLIKKFYVMVASNGEGYDSEKIKTQNSKLKTGLPHPRSFGAFPKVFSEFVKNKSLLGWQEAVYKMTGFPASVLGLQKRGVIAKGAFADILIFNPETIQDKSTYSNPFQFSEGIENVVINGKIVLEKGFLTHETAGRVLKNSTG